MGASLPALVLRFGWLPFGDVIDILVIRHGQSVWNAEGRWQGQADPALTELGRRQAAHAGEALVDAHTQLPFQAVGSSDLARAHVTAQLIAEQLGVDEVTTHEGLRERHAGPFQGLTRSEINRRWPGAIEAREWPDGYERDDALMERVVPGLRAVARNAQRVLAVAHGGVIRALDRLSGAPDESIPNLAGRWYRLADELEPGPRVELVPPEIDLGVE